jgi:hypothetical protein
MSAITNRVLCVAVAFALIVPITEAQAKRNDPPSAPVPVPILTARKAFVSNLGSETGGRDPGGRIREGTFGVGPNRAYDLFYAGLKSWHRYELVATPADGDLVFEISFIHPIEFLSLALGSVDDPQFKLSILDAKTHFVLWTLSAHIETAALAGNRTKKFDQGITDLVQQLKDLVAQPTP